MPKNMKYPEIGDPTDLIHFMHDLAGKIFEGRKVGTHELDRVRALNARDRLFDVVLNILREVEYYARDSVFKFLLQLRSQLLLGKSRSPFLQWLERREQLHVPKWGWVTAVIRPAVLGCHQETSG